VGASAHIAKGLLWLVGGRLANAVLSFGSTAVLARLLTPRDFGIVAASWIVLALANTLFDGAFGVNLLRKRLQRPEDVRTTLTMGMMVAAVFMLIVVATAPLIGGFFRFPDLPMVLAISSLVIPCKAIYAIGTAQLQRANSFAAIAGATLAGQLLGYVVVAIPLSLMGAGIWSLVAAIVVSGIAEATFVGVRARLPLRPMLDPEAVREVARTGLFSVANIMNWIANTGANAIVGRLMGAADLGLYSRGWKLLDLVVGATATPLSRALLPNLAKLRDDRDRLERAFLDVLGIVLPGYAVLSALLALQSPLIVYLALGSQWGDTVPVAQIMFATLLPRCAVKVSENFAVALGRSMSTAVRQALYAMFMVSGTLVGWRAGINGVAVAASAAMILFYLISMHYAVRIGGIDAGAVLTRHVRALLLGALTAAVDFALLRLLQNQAMPIRHLIAGSTAALATGLLFLAAPAFWIGDANAGKFRLMIGNRLRFAVPRPTFGRS